MFSEYPLDHHVSPADPPLRLGPNSQLLRAMAIYSPSIHGLPDLQYFSTDSVLPNVTDPARHYLEAHSQQTVSLVG